MKNFILILICILGTYATAQVPYQLFNMQIGIGDVAKPEAGTAFVVQSTSAVSKPCPEMTALERDALPIKPIGGCVYNSNSLATEFWNGTTWIPAGSSAVLSLWLTGTAYGVGSFVYTVGAPYDFKLWIANTAHVAGATFAGDIANWDEVSNDIDTIAVSTDNAIARWDGVTGGYIQDSSVIIDDSDNMSGIGTLSISSLAEQIGLNGSTYFGFEAGLVDDLTANNNTGFGDSALERITTGQGAVAVGWHAADSLTTGIWNTAIGWDALSTSTTQSNNTAIGTGTLRGNFGTAGGNTAVGAHAMRISSTATLNTAIGYLSLRQGTSYTRNSTLGVESGYNLTAGADNLFLGYQSGYGAVGTSNNRNVFLGAFTGDSVTTGSDNILIGFDIDLPAPTSGDHLNIGGTIFGNLSTNRIGINVVAPTVSFDVLGDSLFTGTSTIVGDLQVDNININGNTIISTDVNGDITNTPNGTGRNIISKEIEMQGPISQALITDAASTGANVTLATPTVGVVRLTNASLTSVDMITAPTRVQKFSLVNHTGVDVIINNATGATPANQILTGTGLLITLEDQSSLNFLYDITEARWMVVGGSGSGVAATLQTTYDESSPARMDIDDTNGLLIFANSNGDPITGVMMSIRDSSDVQIGSFDTDAATPIFDWAGLISALSMTTDALNINSTIDVDGVLDDDTMATASATTLATSESVKAYVDTVAGSGAPLMLKGSLFASDGTNNGEFTACANTEILEWDSTEATGFKCVAKPISYTNSDAIIWANQADESIPYDKVAEKGYASGFSASGTNTTIATVFNQSITTNPNKVYQVTISYERLQDYSGNANIHFLYEVATQDTYDFTGTMDEHFGSVTFMVKEGGVGASRNFQIRVRGVYTDLYMYVVEI